MKCSSELKIRNNPNYLNCPICDKRFYVEPYKQKNNKHPACCSRKCMGELRKEIYLGENNPNFGNTGAKNPMSLDTRITNYGYRLIRVDDHPFAFDGGWVREHRLVAEQYVATDDQCVFINEGRYLDPEEYDVHHINKDRLDNRPENLMVLTRAEHSLLHWEERLKSQK